ncbi:hypothetical protein [uncultured Enterovirga sp.]|uniref:hypothetical protein n=1 Tax=uncultured Enterovirga sp. TaxID=2026352 RepID=UPI0035CB7795
MAGEWGHAERDAVCPVPLEKLGQLHRADPEGVLSLVAEMPESARIKLAVFCYGRAHLRDVGLAIAEQCDETRLAQIAGMIGQVMAVQCRAAVRTFGSDRGDRAVSRPKISLGGRS